MPSEENYFLDPEDGERIPYDDEIVEIPGKVFSIFAYSPDRTDYCRGCEMSRTGSKLDWLCTNNKDEAIEFMANAFKEEYRQIHFLVDGVCVESPHFDNYNQRPGIYRINRDNKYVEEIVVPAIERAKGKTVEAEKKAKAAEELERKRERERQERQEKAQYDRLHQKWGKN